MKKTNTLILCCCLWALPLFSQIDREAVVIRNNPVVEALHPLSSLTVGNGGFAFTVDATGLQTFPEYCKDGIPLGTMSDWGWHSFPNTEGYRAEEALQAYDFGHANGVKGTYSVANKGDQRSKDAAAYLRANPHRLHLGCIGYDIPLADTARIEDVHQEIDLYEGHMESKFSYKNDRYFTSTFVHPERDIVYCAYLCDSEHPVAVKFRFPYPTGKHSDDACDWSPQPDGRNTTVVVSQSDTTAVLLRTIDATTYYVCIHWEAPATFAKVSENTFTLTPQQKGVIFSCEYSEQLPTDEADESTAAIDKTIRHWRNYWKRGAIIDFSHCTDPRARELERRAVLSQYLLAVNCAGDTPPQETGLTYNSWFGKYHLEMIWWHQAQFALWGHPEQLERSLDWYFNAQDKAREIALRQGFPGVRWMKMTDPSAEEAPSKVGSFLIWQQPHVIHLAELLRRAAEKREGDKGSLSVVGKYWPLVEPTATFMQAFADYDASQQRYVLRGVIPAQETLRAAETVNPPFELSYWHWGLNKANQWAKVVEGQQRSEWQLVEERLAPLAFNADSLYLAAETATDTYRDIRFTSDHPAVLGAYGILPWTKQMNRRVMQNTLTWIWDNWNWDKTWGWDYPMVAMNAARMSDPQKAVDALLMDKRTNTYLVSGHNYQDQRLRLYLPGNGGLLTALAMMCAGWDGCNEPNPGFPKDGTWDVRWEGLLPLP